MGEVLGHLDARIEAGTANDYTGLQEVLAVYYLASIGERLELIDEDRSRDPNPNPNSHPHPNALIHPDPDPDARTMLLLCDHQVTAKFVRILASPAAIYDKDVLIVASKANTDNPDSKRHS